MSRQIDADVAGGAGAVVDDELAAELFDQLRGDEARRDVAARAGRESDDDADGAGGVRLGRRGAGEEREEESGGEAQIVTRRA